MEKETGEEVSRRNYLTAAAAGAAVLAASALAGPAQAQKNSPPGPDVRVVNKTTEPVPVKQQGTVQIDTSTPLSVQVDTSTPLPVRNVDESARQLVTFTLRLSGLFTSTPPSAQYRVPTGKRLIIEYVSGSVRTDDQVLPDVGLSITFGAHTMGHAFPQALHRDFGGFVNSAFAMKTFIYVDSDEQITLVTDRSAPHMGVGMTMVGYLVDMP